VSWTGFFWNQIWVVSGNVVGGVVFMGVAYWMTSPVRGWIKKTETVMEAVVYESLRPIRVPADGELLSQPLAVGREN
jgi:hypothetical protein